MKAKTQDPILDQIIQLISRARDEGKAEGAQETLKRLGEFAAAGVLSANPPTASRVPMGTARALIEKALHSGEPLTAAEIRRAASTPAERGLAPTTIYNELSKGLTEGRYQRGDDKRWTLS